MPVINIDENSLNQLLGRSYSPEVLADALEQIGCDVDDIVEITRSRCPNCLSLVDNPPGHEKVTACPFCGHEDLAGFPVVGALTMLRLDLLAARPDLFDVGGLVRALRGTLEIETGLPRYDTQPSGVVLHVDPSTHIRPFIRCAVVRLSVLDETTVAVIMKLQENLHWGVGRDRKLASIGVYDLDTLQGDLVYRTMHPDDEPFVPLGMPGHRMSGRQILKDHPKGAAYAELLEPFDRYPVLMDARGQVLSMPPIINSEETKVTPSSRNLFIDVTGISEAAVVKSLDTLVCSLVELGGRVETVEVHFADRTLITPDLAPRAITISLQDALDWVGVPLTEDSLQHCLRRMRHDVEPAGDGRFEVRYGAYRSDIRHPVDVLEDVAIGYGYPLIQPRLVEGMTVGHARPENALSGMAREVVLGLGYSEIMSLPLTTEESHYTSFRILLPELYPKISNPKLKAYNIVRTHLLTGVMEALRENRRRAMPIRLFEMDDVVNLDARAETGTVETRELAFAEIGREAGYATVRAAVDALLRELGHAGEYQEMEHPSFTPGRAASFTAGPFRGFLGELHPEVITNFDLEFPVAICQMILARVV